MNTTTKIRFFNEGRWVIHEARNREGPERERVEKEEQEREERNGDRIN